MAGLTSALMLTRRGLPVVLIEQEDCPGGLARAFTFGDQRVEQYYHFICRPDRELLALITELGLGQKLHWRSCSTSYFHGEKLYPFGTPFDLLRFTPVPFTQRLRFGFNISQSRFCRNWRGVDQLTAKDWIMRRVGPAAYREIWEPLLKTKFGAQHGAVSAAWLWHRIHRVARSRRAVWRREEFGYLEGGTETLIQRMTDEIMARGGQILLRTAAVRIRLEDGGVSGVELADGRMLPCRFVHATLPLPLLVRLVAEQVSPDYAPAWLKVKEVEYIGVLCLLLRMRYSLTGSFWVNVNSPSIPFSGLIQYSNLNTHFDDGRNHLLYIPFYLPVTDRLYTLHPGVLLKECLPGLKMINPRFDAEWILDWAVHKSNFGQPVCPVGFAARIPPIEGPARGLWISDACQLYPEDRTLSGVIRLGKKVAEAVAQAWDGN